MNCFHSVGLPVQRLDLSFASPSALGQRLSDTVQLVADEGALYWQQAGLDVIAYHD
jgi:hypothetical protein